MGRYGIMGRKTFCGRYRGIEIHTFGRMIGNNWYGDYYAVVRRGKSNRRMRVKQSLSNNILGVAKYIDEHINELKK